jgi:hypothetical protein
MANLNAAAASESRGMVSAECVVLSFRMDGSGAMQLNRDATETPQQFPHAMHGMNVNQLMTDALKTIGIDTSKTRLVQAAFGSTGPGRRALASPEPCRYAIKDSDPSTGYTLKEISNTDFVPMSAGDISDRGQIIGTGQPQPGDQLSIPRSWHNGQLDRLNFTGIAQAVDNSGQIAAMPQEPHKQAALYREGVLVELALYRGEPGIFAGTSSSVVAINDSTLLLATRAARLRSEDTSTGGQLYSARGNQRKYSRAFQLNTPVRQ